jgi:hypothetical protein
LSSFQRFQPITFALIYQFHNKPTKYQFYDISYYKTETTGGRVSSDLVKTH